MKRLFSAILFSALLCSCERPGTWTFALKDWVQSKLPGQAKIGAVPEVPAPTLHLDQTNGDLLQIAANARDTLPLFFRHLLRPAKDESDFSVKYPFRADIGSGFSMEQLWLKNITFKDGVYYGVLANNPFYIASMKKDDTVSFSADEITDWMYVKNGKIVGGLSIKYLLEQIPEHERGGEQKEILQMFE
jgi:uncharacterized protein YegJ (DUF2314 family)